MKPVIIELVQYVEQQTIGAILEQAVARIGSVDMRILSIKLLSWMRERLLTTKHRCLRGKKGYVWCQNFILLLSALPDFGELFCGDGNQFDFRQDVSLEEQNEILQYVKDHYKPKVRTYPVHRHH